MEALGYTVPWIDNGSLNIMDILMAPEHTEDDLTNVATFLVYKSK